MNPLSLLYYYYIVIIIYFEGIQQNVYTTKARV